MDIALGALWTKLGERLGLLPGGVDSSEILRLASGDGEFEVEVARPGRFTAMGGRKVTITPDLLRGLAESHDPGVLRTPNKIGHPDPEKTDTPAQGFVTGLRYDAAKERLFAKVDPSPTLRQAIKDKHFTERSIEFDTNWRGTGKPRFLGLGWLGATPPAIDSLAALAGGIDSGGTLIAVMATGSPEPLEDEEDSSVYYLATFTADERKKLAKEGVAMPDGGYPIRNRADLENAIQAFGRASDPAATKAHIVKRAKALGLTDLLPEGWPGSTKKVAAAEGRTEEEMSEDTAVQLAETKKQMERLRDRVKKGAAERAKNFMSANVKRIPLKLVKAGLEEKLSAIFAAEAEEEHVIKFAEGGEEKSVSFGDFVTGILAELPEQVTAAEGKETATKGEPGDEEGGGEDPLLMAGATPESLKMHRAVEKTVAEAKAKGETLSYLEGVRIVERARNGRK